MSKRALSRTKIGLKVSIQTWMCFPRIEAPNIIESQMEVCSQLVSAYMISENGENVEQVAAALQNGEFTLLQLVQSLGEYITAIEPDIRSKGLDLLVHVIGQCPPSTLSAQSTRVLSTFLSGKLDDYDTIEPALKGLAVLVGHPTFSDASASEVAISIFQHVRMRSLTQAVRYNVFRILDSLVQNHRQAMRLLDRDFVSGYVSIAEGEKDPRSLLLSFSVVRVLLIEFPIQAHIENLFDVTFCYFPITFKPPPGDPYGISAEDLRTSLLSCLNATPLFGPLALPLFLEKLSASSGSLKRIILDTVTACLPVYGRNIVRDFGSDLWEIFKIEIFQPADPETEACSMRAVQSLVRTLYPPRAGDSSDQLDGLIEDMVNECKTIVREPEKSQAKHAVKLLGALLCTQVPRYAIEEVFPHLFVLYRNPDEISFRASTLTCISAYWRHLRREVTEKPLSGFEEQLFSSLAGGLKIAAARRPSIEGLLQLVKVPGVCSVDKLRFISQSMNEILVSDSRDVELEDLRLPGSSPPKQELTEHVRYRRILASLSALCPSPSLFETLVIRLTSKLDLLCRPRPIDLDLEGDAAYAYAVLSTVKDVITAKAQNKHLDLPKYGDRLVVPLYNIFLKASISPEDAHSVATNTKVLSVAAKIVTLITRTLSHDRQRTLFTALFLAFRDGDLERLMPDLKLPEGTGRFDPFSRYILVRVSQQVFTTASKVSLPFMNPSEDFLKYLNWSLSDTIEERLRTAVWQFMATHVNKRPDDFMPLTTRHLPQFWKDEIGLTTQDVERRKAALRGYIWIHKGLLARNHPDTTLGIKLIFTVFDDPQIGWDAARGIGELVKGGRDVLVKENFCSIRPLYAQRFVSSVLLTLLEGSTARNEAAKQPYIVGLTCLVTSVPKAMYSYKLSVIMPLLLRGMDLPDETIRINVVDTLYAMASDKSTQTELIEEHASAILNALLFSSDPRHSKSPALRCSSLRCLGVLPSAVKYSVLHPYKQKVIAQLGRFVDDPKRRVRKEAVDARHVIFLPYLIGSLIRHEVLQTLGISINYHLRSASRNNNNEKPLPTHEPLNSNLDESSIDDESEVGPL
ncbi:ARM repeat-containing protein [Cantharellus anzutake]|uniref:ARM repeat-containing protein n=1 Tax=Cantharellus anzutake TaxID=1750568 RepID=UPI001903805C|nr:ARM repeat-containing protein [Cantharellus anzutake]KAF8328366.1 ARM repeat-containing protein [Cantharellus anzutake]